MVRREYYAFSCANLAFAPNSGYSGINLLSNILLRLLYHYHLLAVLFVVSLLRLDAEAARQPYIVQSNTKS